jgi:hypothetical protein
LVKGVEHAFGNVAFDPGLVDVAILRGIAAARLPGKDLLNVELGNLAARSFIHVNADLLPTATPPDRRPLQVANGDCPPQVCVDQTPPAPSQDLGFRACGMFNRPDVSVQRVRGIASREWPRLNDRLIDALTAGGPQAAVHGRPRTATALAERTTLRGSG